MRNSQQIIILDLLEYGYAIVSKRNLIAYIFDPISRDLLAFAEISKDEFVICCLVVD